MTYKLLLVLVLALAGTGTVFSQGNWPKEIGGPDGSKITMYQPQPESMSGSVITGRAAVSTKKPGETEPVFGAILFSATVSNRSSTDLLIESLQVTRVKFSGVEDQAYADKIASLIEKEAAGWRLGMTKDELSKAIDKEQGAIAGSAFNNAPPKIIYTNTPSTLIVLDGEPRLVYDESLKVEKVANTPHIIIKDGKTWNLYAGGNWYKSNSIKDGWQLNNNLSSKVNQVNRKIKEQEAESRNAGDEKKIDSKPTEIIVVTEPTELIQTDGEPQYSSVTGTSLLYVSNSPNQVFKDINSQKTYILLAGRWYQSNSMNGPWKYIASDELPADFARIPEGSDKDAVLANVAGTEPAEEAILDAAIPQTAKVDRRKATVDVEYDGKPIFNRIKGTSLWLAENSNLTVMMDADRNYFALDNGIWFISDNPDGPWAVANDRPRDVDDIPASSPAYYSRYVHIYDVTPDYVYMGYTSGYLGSYIYGPTIVYGTGYHYRPWFRRYYYPRPITWGFGFVYDPWYGWNINWGFSYGFLHVGWFDYGPSWYGYGGWFGPSRYCPYYRNYYYYDRGYYGYNRYGYGGRNYYGNTYNNNYYNVTYNVYNNQQGVTTRDASRTRSSNYTRLRNTSDNAASVGSGSRLQRGTSRTPALNNPNTGTTTNPGGLRPINRNNRQFENGGSTSDNSRVNSRRDVPGVSNNREGQTPAVGTPERVQRRIGEREQQADRQNTEVRPSASERWPQNRNSGAVQRTEPNRASAPDRRPQVQDNRSDRPQRVEYNRAPSQERRPQIQNNSGDRPQRVEYNRAPSQDRRPQIQNSQPQRPQRTEFNRSSAPQRPTINHQPRSSQGGGGSVNADRGRRIGR